MSQIANTYRPQLLAITADLPTVIATFNDLQTSLRHDLSSLALYRSVASPAQITANQNDYPIGSSRVVRLSTDASRNITGLRNAGTGLVNVANAELTIVNVGSFNLVLQHQNTGSAAANRFLLEAGADLTLAPNDSVTLYYDLATSRWRDLNVRPLSDYSGRIGYAQLPTGSGSWDTGVGTTVTITQALTVSGLGTFSGLLTASAGITVPTGQAVTLSGTTTLTVGGVLTASAGINVTAGTLVVDGGGVFRSNITFTDNTYDIGASGANRPRDLFLSRNATISGTATISGLLTASGGITTGPTNATQLTGKSSATTSPTYAFWTSSDGISGDFYWGVEKSAGGGIFTGSSGYAAIIGTSTAKNLEFAVSSAVKMLMKSGGEVDILTGPLVVGTDPGGTATLRVGGDVATNNPGGGGGKWKLGKRTAAVGLVLLTTNYVEIDIDGTIVKLAEVT